MAGLVSAPVAIVEYSDFECPSCAQFAREVEPHLRKEYIDKGKVVLVYKHFPLSIHPMAGAAARAAWCAARQGKPWEMHDRLFRIRKGLQDSDLVSAAQEIGLDITVYNSCRVGGEAAKQVEMDRAEGDKFKIPGTPTLFIGRTTADRHVQVTDVIVGNKLEELRVILNRLLSG